MELTILIRGSGDIGSAVAHRLFLAGYQVALHDLPRPGHSRRGMAFVDALFDAVAILEGVTGRYAADPQKVTGLLMDHQGIPVSDAPFDLLCSEIRPDVVVDARMCKRIDPEAQLDLAPVTIGLGPGFEAGNHVRIAIETARGGDLGAARWSGRTRDLCGEPCMLGDAGRERFVYAPHAGRFQTSHALAESVTRGVQIGTLENTALHAPLTGIVRGLSHTGAEVEAGSKIIEIDPREHAPQPFGLGERPRAIAEGVCRALQADAVDQSYFFGFETDKERRLVLIPMSIRLKLDTVELKISLKQWQQLPGPIRRTGLEMPCDLQSQVDAYRAYLTRTAACYMREAIEPVSPAEPVWRDDAVIPAAISEAALAHGLTPITPEQWRQLTTLQRYALIKLSRKGHTRNLPAAWAEFGLERNS
ncbi:MAG: nitrate reductase associated protein [Gammaproteobacteria bacterium]